MNNIKTNKVFYALTALFFLLNVCLWMLTLSDALFWISSHYSVTLDKQKVLAQFVNEGSWFKFKLLVAVCWTLFVLLGEYGMHIIKEFCVSFCFSFGMLRQDFVKMKRYELIFLISILITLGSFLFWFSNEIDFQLDELNSWLYFVDRGFLVTMSYYPSNNNHVGYNVISVLWSFIFEPRMAMRITSILSSLAILSLLYLMLLKRYILKVSVVGIFIAITSSSFVWYSIQGRGYVLELLLLVLVFYFILESTEPKVDYTLAILSAYVLWVIPVSIIPLIVLALLYVYVIRNDKFIFKRVVTTFTIVVLLSVLLYAPIWIFSDVSTLYSNPFVKHVLWENVPQVLVFEYLPALGSFLLGIEGFSLLLLLASMLGITLWMVFSKHYFVLCLTCIVLILPIVLFVFYPVLIFERTWLWLWIPFVFWFSEVFQFMLFKTRTVSLIGIAIGVLTLLYANVSLLFDVRIDVKKWESELVELRTCICKADIKTLYVESDILYTYFRYYQKECGFVLNRESNKASVKDWIFLLPEQTNSVKKELVCENSIGRLYKRQ